MAVTKKMKVNKRELVEFMVEEGTATTKAEGERMIKAVVSAVLHYLGEDREARVSGLGSFRVKTRAARKGRNPRTGEEIDISPKAAVFFKASKKLKDAIAI